MPVPTSKYNLLCQGLPGKQLLGEYSMVKSGLSGDNELMKAWHELCDLSKAHWFWCSPHQHENTSWLRDRKIRIWIYSLCEFLIWDFKMKCSFVWRKKRSQWTPFPNLAPTPSHSMRTVTRCGVTLAAMQHLLNKGEGMKYRAHFGTPSPFSDRN